MTKNMEVIANGKFFKDYSTELEEEPIDYESSEVAKFFEGLNILVTGGSGFLGRLLVEKLLRSCPKLGKIYILMRSKKGKTPEQRFNEHFDEVIYGRLKKERPDFMSKVEMIEGDTSMKDLNISPADRQRLIESVQVVLHGAATVRFDESLRQAVNINVRGTKSILLFAREMKNLKVFVHVSTAFSHCILKNIEEKFYDPPMDPDKVISLVEMLDDDLLGQITPNIIGKWPNTYAFSKAAGEEVINKYSKGIPACIVRPSIMIGTHKEPIRGWINNYYGATGVVMGAGIGLLRSLHCEADNVADIIPADFVINNIIVAAWDTYKTCTENGKKIVTESDEKAVESVEPPIYNSVSSCQKPIKWGEFMELNEMHGRHIPSAMVLWHYCFTLNRSLLMHNIYCFFLHTIPGALVDALAVLIGREPILTKAYRKIHKFSGVISYFSTQEWKFNNDNVLKLWDRTNEADRKIFNFNLSSLDWSEFFYHNVRGLRVHILKDPLNTIEVGRVKLQRLKFAHYTIVTVLSVLLIWFLYGFVKFLLSLLLLNL